MSATIITYESHPAGWTHERRRAVTTAIAAGNIEALDGLGIGGAFKSDAFIGYDYVHQGWIEARADRAIALPTEARVDNQTDID